MKRIGALLGCAVLFGVIATAESATPVGFTPKLIAGTWNGSWTNTTFGSTGPAKIVGKALAQNTKLQFTVDFGGNVFGCTDPGAETSKLLTKGTGFGHWNAAGFKTKGTSKAFGAMTLAYAYKTKAIAGSGSNPACATGLSWKIAGKFTGKVFNGTINITLADSSTAVSTLTLTKS
jgi:hypothetical protein